ncbi:MAG: flagellar assembly protein FliH [Aeromicrobium sp.]|nr:flagellar assembly protein FliH [Burkholderiales bacterium]
MTLMSKAKFDGQHEAATRWKFASFGDGADCAGDSSLHGATREDLLSGKQLARRALESAYQRGLAEGFHAGTEHITKESGSMAHRVDSLVASLQSQFAAFDKDVADAVLGLAFSLARQVIRTELELRPELVTTSVKDALHSLALKATFPGIYVHPDDLNLIKPALGEDLAVRGCRLIADASISRGGCRLESDTSTVDATIESRWERALSNMGYNGSEYDNVTPAR